MRFADVQDRANRPFPIVWHGEVVQHQRFALTGAFKQDELDTLAGECRRHFNELFFERVKAAMDQNRVSFGTVCREYQSGQGGALVWNVDPGHQRVGHLGVKQFSKAVVGNEFVWIIGRDEELGSAVEKGCIECPVFGFTGSCRL